MRIRPLTSGWRLKATQTVYLAAASHTACDMAAAPGSFLMTGELPPAIELDLHRHGGHVGFVGGRLPWKPRYWLDERIPAWLQKRM